MPILGFTSKILPLYFIFKLEILLFLKFNFKTSVFVKIVKLGLFLIGFKKDLADECLNPL